MLTIAKNAKKCKEYKENTRYSILSAKMQNIATNKISDYCKKCNKFYGDCKC